MYKTTGIIDKSFCETIEYHVYSKNRMGLLKFCITILALYYLLSAFLIRDLVSACIGVFGISLYTFVIFYTVKKSTKINIRIMQESYHTDSIDMSTEFTEDVMIISSSARQDTTEIYYHDISRVILTSKYYLIFTKAKQLICVFADQLQERDRLGLIGFLKEKAPKIKIYKENKKRKYFAGAGLILLYLSFLIFLFTYFKTPENSTTVNDDVYAETVEPQKELASIEEKEGAEIEQPEITEITYQIENPSWEYYCSDTVQEVENIAVNLELIYEVENDITDLDVWLASNEIAISQFPYSDENYSYTFTGVQFYETTNLVIFELSGEKHIYHIDMTDFSMLPEKIFEENDPFTQERGYVNFARIVDNILYVSTGHKGYTEYNPSTGYITAINLDNGEVLWKSAPQVSNANNFEVVGDVIICGYGFTAEDDYLYILNKFNGQIIEQIPLKSMAEYIVAKDSTLYVRTYNRNYEFAIVQTEEVETDVSDTKGGISANEYLQFSKTVDETVVEQYNVYDRADDILRQDFTGTWYDPEAEEAIRLTSEGAYVYISNLEKYGDILYEWELIDRSKQGLCPELAIYMNGKLAGPLAYYVTEFGGDYFRCDGQGQTFYRQ